MNNLYHIPLSPHEGDTTILSGYYESRYFEIVTYRGHPNAYVSFPEGATFNNDYDVVEVGNPHGGYTFLGWRQNLLMLGWDYSHLGDFNAMSPSSWEKKWNLAEICAEIISVIDALNSAY